MVDGARGWVGGGLVEGRKDVGIEVEEGGEPRGLGWWGGVGRSGELVEMEGKDLVLSDLGFFEAGG